MHAKFQGAAGMFAVAVLLAGPAMADKTRIDFWFGNTGDIAKRVQEQCDRFNQSQSDYEVTCTSQGSYDASLQNTIAAFRAGKQPTIAQVSDAGTLDIMLSGAFYPANKLMADMGYTVDWNDYFSGIKSYYATSKGDMYSFPFNSSTPLLYWNKDAFAKIGKDHAPATWEEAAEDFKALKAAGYACPLGFNISRDEIWQYGEQFLAVHGEPLASKRNGYDGLDAELVFNKGLWVKYIKDLKSWYDAGEAVLKSKETGQTFVEAFAAGDCQVILTSVGDHGNIGRTAEEGLTWSTVTGYIPVRNSGYEYLVKNGFYDKAPYAGRELAIKSLTASPATADGLPGIRLGGLLQIRQEMANGLQAIFINNADVQASLDQAAERGNQILRRFQQTYEGKQLP